MAACAWWKGLLRVKRPQAPLSTCNAFLSTQAPPKRPMGSFFLFVRDEKQEVDKPRSLFIKEKAEKWRSMSSEEKQPYVERQNEELEKYRQEQEIFLESLSDFELDQMKHEKALKREDRLKRRQKRLKKTLGKPKQPKTAYIFYMQSRATSSRSLAQVIEDTKSFAADWRNLSENQKQEFYHKAELDRERYKAEMEDYVSNLQDKGHEELIPRTYIIQMRREERKKQEAEKLQELIDKSAEKLRNL